MCRLKQALREELDLGGLGVVQVEDADEEDLTLSDEEVDRINANRDVDVEIIEKREGEGDGEGEGEGEGEKDSLTNTQIIHEIQECNTGVLRTSAIRVPFGLKPRCVYVMCVVKCICM